MRRVKRKAKARGMEYAPGKIMVGQSPAMKHVFFLIGRYAPSGAPVLVTGDTGTGKELVARAIHHHSGRTGRFVAVNCAGIPDALFESEFFGHRRGAFTGAVADRAGLFEQAGGGTLFLDEIGELPPGQQAKLLRVLEDGVVRPVGSNREVEVTARIVAATNRDLDKAVEEGRFREDLLDRLRLLPVEMPSLAERIEDLHPLILHLVESANRSEGTKIAAPSRDRILANGAQLGETNIRRLKASITRLAVLKQTGTFTAQELLGNLRGGAPCREPLRSNIKLQSDDHLNIRLDLPVGLGFKAVLDHVGRAITDEALEQCDGRVGRARESLGMSKDMWYRLRA